ncbi:MAG: NlpC/P60 family protein [Patescibacteria group bacterium]
MPIEDFLGIPYRLNGRDRNGMDCVGLVVMYLRSLGINVPDGDGRPVDANWRRDGRERIQAWLDAHARRVDVPGAGDIVFFIIPGGTVHLGVMVDGESVLHIMEDRDSMLTPLRRISRRLAGIYRLR